MLRLRRDLLDAMVAHCRAEHPIEACGVIAGRGDFAERHIPMRNAEASRTRYEMDPDQQLAVWRDMDDRGERPVVIYHSHTATEAYPSAPDVRFAAEADAHYVIVSTRANEPEVRSYRITAGNAEEEPVEVLDLSTLAMAAVEAAHSEIGRHLEDAAREAVQRLQVTREPETPGSAIYCRPTDATQVWLRVATGDLPDLPVRFSALVPEGKAVIVDQTALAAKLREDLANIPWLTTGTDRDEGVPDPRAETRTRP